jgi:hypothetical protein
MASNTNKIYKIKNKRTGEYISLGYNSKKTWLTFPSQALKYNTRLMMGDTDNYEVEQFELVKTKSFTIDGQEIK